MAKRAALTWSKAVASSTDERIEALRVDLAQRAQQLRALRAEQQRLRRQCDAVRRELNHVIRQSQSAIYSILRMHAAHAQSDEVRRFAERLQTRVQAMAAVYMQRDLNGLRDRINLGPVVRSIGTNIAATLAPPRGIGLRIRTADIEVEADRARSLALITAELVENAYIHAFVNRRFGAIEIGVGPFNVGAGMLWVDDNGIGVTAEILEQRHGLGWKTIEALATSIAADIVYERRQGTRIGVVFPN